MVQLKIRDKLAILSDAAKYDASCASSGTTKRNSADGKGLGSTESMGICHAYAPDGRCISLLKILMTNFCIYDCAYCINRASSNVQRARFTPDEVVWLTIEFYRRNYIEGLFLSSGIIKSPDDTMTDMVRIARDLRQTHSFRGYIHLKTIPDAAPALVEEAGLYADRLSINIELPQDQSVTRYAPQKSPVSIRKSMADLRLKIDEHSEPSPITKKKKRFTPAGQSTQMIIGADASTDEDILVRSESLYSGYQLRRVYYSAFSPIPDSSSALPLIKPPLIREHRLYQADWLTRFYGFSAREIMSAQPGGMLDLDLDPKLAWALANRGAFPVDVNTAAKETLLRVPGFGSKSVGRILTSRRIKSLRYDDLVRLGAVMSKARPFIACLDWNPSGLTDSEGLKAKFQPAPQQLSLF
ncbi:putative DNA modification/repair radical SAM protein [Rhizobium sp. SG_E_25_P2]|uniref:putative DNA modification/repair radical SAM protein n=1 Tax=Rhizobium sp. SG_E_25_P2 TaxID=2879942 RepID=UPI002474172D|nr:putative DNA modification/repair radical SAM protein [Rhizobium sp. SG_E_25_P2]MDH6265576.1 putative DNA modification/repair radical SAM protein [Rhizobium sp. SG_E_25_P2]